MLKINTVLTAACVVLLGLVSWLGTEMWGDIKETKTATTTMTTQVNTISKEVDDHETRIRQTERDVTILQQQRREDRAAWNPKMLDTKP